VGEISADSRDPDGTTFRDYGTKKTDIIFVIIKNISRGKISIYL
jgi:hypothetical protein